MIAACEFLYDGQILLMGVCDGGDNTGVEAF